MTIGSDVISLNEVQSKEEYECVTVKIRSKKKQDIADSKGRANLTLGGK